MLLLLCLTAADEALDDDAYPWCRWLPGSEEGSTGICSQEDEESRDLPRIEEAASRRRTMIAVMLSIVRREKKVPFTLYKDYPFQRTTTC